MGSDIACRGELQQTRGAHSGRRGPDDRNEPRFDLYGPWRPGRGSRFPRSAWTGDELPRAGCHLPTANCTARCRIAATCQPGNAQRSAAGDIAGLHTTSGIASASGRGSRHVGQRSATRATDVRVSRTGQGLQSDADRARTELSLREIEFRRAAEDAQVASIRLARLLSLDPAEPSAPQEPALEPIDLVAPDMDSSELISVGLSNRPELAESQCLVAEAVERWRRERVAPLVPSVVLGMSYGGNGGGLGSDIRHFGDRMDFDAVAYWEVRNLGLGERAAQDQAGSRVDQARWQQVQVMDQVASEVAEAHAQVAARREQIDLAESAIQTAAESFRRNAERIREGQGLPIETLQAIQALDQARRAYVRAVGDYNRAQFRLHRALGWPIHDV